MDFPALDELDVPTTPKPPARSRLRVELGPMLRLAGPVVVAELGWMMMAVVDTVVVRDLGAEATGAVGLGGSLFMAVTIFGIGLLFGLDTVVSQEHGAGLGREAKRSLAQGVYLGVAAAPFVIGAIRAMVSMMPAWGIGPEVVGLTGPYLRALSWSAAPLLVFAAFRRYLQGVGVVKPITFALVSANLVNWLACRALVYGEFGLPRMGVEGAGWATCLARSYMMVVLVAAYARYSPGEWWVEYYGGNRGVPVATRWKVRVKHEGRVQIIQGRLNVPGGRSQTYTLTVAGPQAQAKGIMLDFKP